MEHLFNNNIVLQMSRGGRIRSVMVDLQEKEDGSCSLCIRLPDEVISVAADDFFDCLCQLKERHPDMLLYCKGYKKNVYPSAMARQMGKGLMAYEMTQGRPAERENLVGIFDAENQDLTSSNEEQRAFREKWLDSL